MRIPFAPPPGLSSDDTDFSAPGLWDDGSNVRFRLGRPETIGGWADAIGGAAVSGVCRNVFTLDRGDSDPVVVFGTHSHLQVFAADALHDVTPPGLVEGAVDGSSDATDLGWSAGGWGEGTWSDGAIAEIPRTWSLANYGAWLIANPRGGTIYAWEGDPAAPAAPVANAPDIVTFALVTPERQLVAFGCSEEAGGNFNPLCIRASDIENIEDWTTTPSNNAFEHVLEGGGRLVAAAIIGPRIGVWTNKAFWIAEFVGDPAQTYRIDKVADNCGLVGPNAFAVSDQGAYWVSTDGQFRRWSLGGGVSIIPCPIWRDFAGHVASGQHDKIVAHMVSSFGEVWFHYPDARDGAENSRYVAFCVAESAAAGRPVWFRGLMDRSAAMDAGTLAFPLMAAPAGSAYFHEHGNTADGAALPNFLRSGAQYVDEGGRRMMIRSVEPDFEGQQANVALTLGVRGYPNGIEAAKGPVTLGPSTRRRNLRAAGRLVSIRLDSGGYWRLGKPVLDAVPMGRRG